MSAVTIAVALFCFFIANGNNKQKQMKSDCKWRKTPGFKLDMLSLLFVLEVLAIWSGSSVALIKNY